MAATHQGDASATSFEDSLIEKMENVVLKSDDDRATEIENVELESEEDNGERGSDLVPLRPYAGDCVHYVRTGTCKFGLSCKFNHPVKKAQMNLFNASDYGSESIGTIECKYFSTAEGCKYGKSCRYNHPGEESENRALALNVLGLPMRLGEKECPYYLRYGSCGYGSRCVFHHPEPTTMARKEALVPMAENGNVGSLDQLGMSSPGQLSWSLHSLSANVGPYSEGYSYTQWMGKQSEWNGSQGSSYSNQSNNSYSTTMANGSVRKTDVPMQVDEFPERPGQPDCDFFMKTGNCKFKSTCRFHHPKNRISRPDERALNENGLPLRPGRSVCRHYERHGLCKFGPACLFDHPATHRLSTYPVWTASSTAYDGGNGW